MRDPEQAERGDVVEIGGGVPGAEGLHGNVFDFELETEGDGHGEEFEDLLLRFVVRPDEVVVEGVEEADLD